ncbi:DUF5687 family protein [Dyadobacter sp. 3J3]|uniref:DUF5687 family protein n=1 Tax=Dyadobacter sp. 3J3 TaxID=2606600 RepID=UPI0013595660|nr:DUF5687 family protein [Dyadobacter sp. 3J3]
MTNYVVKFCLIIFLETIGFWRQRYSLLGKIFFILEVIYKLYFCILIVFFGQSLDAIFDFVFPKANSLDLINRYFFDYLFLDFTVRVFFQGTNFQNVSGYLILPIQKGVILTYVLINQIVSLLNFFSLVLFTSISIYFIIPRDGVFTGILWILGSWALILTNDLVLRQIKEDLSLKLIKTVLVFIGILLIIKNITSWIPYEPQFVFYPYFSALCFLTYCLLFYYYIPFIRQRLYGEYSPSSAKEGFIASDSLNILSRFGLVGELLILEWRLTTRNRRPKDLMAISVVLIIYLMFIAFKVSIKASSESYLLYMFSISIFSCLSIMVNYGQFIYGWEGSYFDSILTNKIPFKEYIRAKRIWLSACCLIGFLITLPFAFFSPELLKYLIPSFFIGLGITLPLMIFFANYNRKSIDVSKGIMFNYEGINTFQYLNMAVNFVLLGIVLLPFWHYDSTIFGIWILGGIGMISSFFGARWDRFQERLFYKYKYELTQSLRK